MKYNCKENDVIIEKKEDEIWVSVEGDTKCGKTVVGLKDLNEALILFGVGSRREQLICIKNEGHKFITLYKQYEVYEETRTYYTIKADLDNFMGFDKSLFKKIKTN